MTWKDDLRRVVINGRNLIGASFRSVPFFVDTSDLGGGRRIVVHQFPFRDDPYVEDLGKKARTFRLDGYVLGDDYLTQRDALLSALEDTSGPGKLVHPYYGVLTAICIDVGVSETKSEGGFAKFSLQFAEAPAQTPVPVAEVDQAGEVSDAADAANAASDAQLASDYNASNLPGYALGSAQTALTNATSSLKSNLAPVISATQELASLNAQATVLVATAAQLVTTPALIMGQFRNAIAALVTTALDAPEAMMNALISAYDVNMGTPVTPTTATRTQELANQTALIAALRRTFAIEASRLAPTVPFTSIDDALAARDSITALLDTEAEEAGDTAYGALVDLRAQMQQAVPGTSAFASIVTATRRTTLPSLLLTYQLYGSVDLESDVLARNDVMHPGFVVGTLKVLSNEQ